MPDRTYQVRVAGLAPDLRQQDVGDHHLSAQRIRTVLVGRFGGQHALLEFLRHLRAYGLDIIGVRRLPHVEASESRKVVGATVASTVSDHASYELTVSGDVDPELHTALTPYATALEELHTVPVHAGAPRTCSSSISCCILEAQGAKIASIAVVGHPLPNRRCARRFDAGSVAPETVECGE